MLAEQAVPAVGLGCMSLSYGYGTPPPKEHTAAFIRAALDVGYVHIDSAALYGFGHNEKLLGPLLRTARDRIFLVSKAGIDRVDGVRVIDNSPEWLRMSCERSLRRLETDVLDLFYLHRWDKKTPIEESVGELGRLVEEGKIRAIGLSEVSAGTLRRAHQEHPIAAVQSEYSLWSRNAEIAVLDACEELDIAYVAFSPTARGFLANPDMNPAEFSDGDLRRGMPRFQSPDFEMNRKLLPRYKELADQSSCTPAQLALAWLLQKSPLIHVIPGTTDMDHAAENFAALEVELSAGVVDSLESLINPNTVSGPRYNDATQAEIDTEQ